MALPQSDYWTDETETQARWAEDEYLAFERASETKHEFIDITKSGLNYVYPDLSVVCGDVIYDDEKKRVLTNPTLVVEILAPSTESYDRGLKFQRYRQLASLRMYLLISQERAHLELFTRQEDDTWLLSEAQGREQTLNLDALGVPLPLAEVYAQVSTDDIPD